MAQERSEIDEFGNDETEESVLAKGGLNEIGDDDDDAVETEQIREQIEETRKGMGETIDAIQERLSIANISEQVSEQVGMAVEAAKDAAYGATIGKVTEFMKSVGTEIGQMNIGRTVKQNPLPFIFIGLGAGLLAYQGLSGGRKPARAKNGNGKQNQANGEAGNASGVGTSLSSASDAVTGAVGSAYERVTGAASGVVGQASEKVGDLRTAAGEKYEYYIEENPLAVGAVALAVGAAIGFAVPSTRYEGNLMGETRQNLFDKAQTAASGLLDKGQELAEQAGETLSEKVSAARSGDTV